MLKVLTRQETADLLKLSLRSLDYLTATKQIPFKRMGRSIRFSESALQRWMDNEGGTDFGIEKSKGSNEA